MKPRQFDVCPLATPRSGSVVSLVVVLQHDLVDTLNTRVIAPLVPVGDDFVMNGATVMVEVDGRRLAAALHLLATANLRELGAPIVNLDSYEPAIKRALDLLFLGF